MLQNFECKGRLHGVPRRRVQARLEKLVGFGDSRALTVDDSHLVDTVGMYDGQSSAQVRRRYHRASSTVVTKAELICRQFEQTPAAKVLSRPLLNTVEWQVRV